MGCRAQKLKLRDLHGSRGLSSSGTGRKKGEGAKNRQVHTSLRSLSCTFFYYTMIQVVFGKINLSTDYRREEMLMYLQLIRHKIKTEKMGTKGQLQIILQKTLTVTYFFLFSYSSLSATFQC